MSARERLIELIVQANELCSNKDCAECEYLNNDRILCDTYNIADYLIANGVIVPPCKVGDTVYFEFNEKVTQGTINAIKAEAQKELAEKVNKMITEIYNKHIFGANDLNDEEKDAIINFSDDVTSEIENILKESVSGNNAE